MTYYLLSSNSEPRDFIQRCKVEELILCPGKKIYFEGQEEKTQVSSFPSKERKKPVITILKTFQPTKRDLRKNNKGRKLVSCLISPRSPTGWEARIIEIITVKSL